MRERDKRSAHRKTLAAAAAVIVVVVVVVVVVVILGYAKACFFLSFFLT
jgi:ABC-type uncharacterized transport system permease subunit